MTVQLSLSEVQVAVVEYLRKGGMSVESIEHVRLELICNDGTRMNIVSCTPTVVVYGVKMPEGGPYR